MKESDALSLIRGYAEANRYEITRHAWQRMQGMGRNVTTSSADVHRALCHAHQAMFQPKDARWKIEGPDTDGDALTVVVELGDGLVVVTVI